MKQKMLKNTLLKILIFIILISMSTFNFALATDKQRKWRIVYVEGGAYKDYAATILGFAYGLKNVGLIENGDVLIPEKNNDAQAIWSWLSQNASNDKIEFLKDGFYSANWNEAKRQSIKQELLERIKTKNDIDCIIALGTWAGQDLSSNVRNIPVLSMSTTDPVLSGIIKSSQDSGFDNVHAALDTDRQARQLTMFHNIFKFQRLGVPYEDSKAGRSTMAIDTIEKLAKKLNFELVPCTSILESSDNALSFNNLKQCLNTLAKESDAIYLTVNNGMQASRMLELLEPIIKNKIPTFSQSGPEETKLGVLMSLAQDNYMDLGYFEAKVLKQVMSGVLPRHINQIYEAPPTLAINLEMALRIGWNPPFEVLVAVDEIYQHIENGKQ